MFMELINEILNLGKMCISNKLVIEVKICLLKTRIGGLTVNGNRK